MTKMTKMIRSSVTIPCSAQYDLFNTVTNLKYRIQISWPLNWTRTKECKNAVPVMYILDGTALFLTASEILWRRGTSPSSGTGGVIVAIGYQHDMEQKHSLFDNQRNFDMTLPGPDGPQNGLGGADAFLDFVDEQVKPLVRREFPGITSWKECIFGHSFGGLCVLHALFTRRGMFNMHFAASPSIWWDESILQEEKRYKSRNRDSEREEDRPSLELSYGSLEQNPIRLPKESAEDFSKRKELIRLRAMGQNAMSMQKRLEEYGQLKELSLRELEGEDHATAMTGAILKAITRVFGHASLH